MLSRNNNLSFCLRGISDNVHITFELVHYMRMKKHGVDGEVALKLDVSKAYDRVDCNFLKNRIKMGFNEKWIR